MSLATLAAAAGRDVPAQLQTRPRTTRISSRASILQPPGSGELRPDFTAAPLLSVLEG